MGVTMSPRTIRNGLGEKRSSPCWTPYERRRRMHALQMGLQLPVASGDSLLAAPVRLHFLPQHEHQLRRGGLQSGQPGQGGIAASEASSLIRAKAIWARNIAGCVPDWAPRKPSPRWPASYPACFTGSSSMGSNTSIKAWNSTKPGTENSRFDPSSSARINSACKLLSPHANRHDRDRVVSRECERCTQRVRASRFAYTICNTR